MNQASNSCEEKSSYLMPRCVLKKMPSKRYTTCGKDVQRAKKKTHTHTTKHAFWVILPLTGVRIK